MHNEPEYFSVYGSGYSAERQQGFEEFRKSIGWRAVAQVWGVTLIALTLGAAVTHVAGSAHAGAAFMQRVVGR
jgi:hypothetical protein